jgi:23S rRNA pseudouridine2605 synthase
MTNPRYRTKRVYHVTLDKPLQVRHARQVAEGVELEDGVTAPTEVFIFPDEPSKVRITLIEGKNREIRRIFESLGYMVKKLDRKEYSILNAKGLNRGEYRHLTRKEVELLKKSIKLL